MLLVKIERLLMTDIYEKLYNFRTILSQSVTLIIIS